MAHFAANYSKYEWEVYLDNGNPLVKPLTMRGDTGGVCTLEPPLQSPFPVPSLRNIQGMDELYENISTKVDDGWIICFATAGDAVKKELWWFSLDVSRKYKISEDKIVKFFKIDNQLFALEGRSYLEGEKKIDTGKILLLQKQSGTSKWISDTILILPQAPHAGCLIDDGSLYIVTTSSVLKVSDMKKVDVIVKDAFWEGLYPVSIIKTDSGLIYIGMRQGVAKLNISDANQKIEWLVPSQKRLEEDLEIFNNFVIPFHNRP